MSGRGGRGSGGARADVALALVAAVFAVFQAVAEQLQVNALHLVEAVELGSQAGVVAPALVVERPLERGPLITPVAALGDAVALILLPDARAVVAPERHPQAAGVDGWCHRGVLGLEV